MRHIILLCILCFALPSVLKCQVIRNCSYTQPITVYERININAISPENLEAISLIRRMLKPVGLEPNFIPVKIDGIENCAAITRNGIRFIVFDESFLQKLNSFGNTDWIKISVFAHEIGHLLNGHTTYNTASLEENREQELQADEFSGFLLQKNGATLSEAQAGINLVADNFDSDTHPSKNKRLYAIEKGFKNSENLDKKLIQKNQPNPEKIYVEAYESFNNLLNQSNKFHSKLDNVTHQYSSDQNLNLDKIEEKSSTAISLNNTFYDAYNLRAEVRYLKKNFEGAIRDLNEVLRLNPNNSFALYKLGEIEYKNNNNLEKALSYLNECLKSDSTIAGYYLMKGIVLSHLHRENEAIAMYNIAIRINPSDGTNYYNRGFSFANLGKKEEAESSFLKSIEVKPNNPSALYELGKIYQAERKLQDAIKNFTKAIELEPSYSFAYNRRGEVYESLSNDIDAMKDYNKAIELDSKFPFPYKNRGFLFLKNKDYSNAILDLDRSVELNPNGEEVFYIFLQKGKAKVNIGDYKGGLEDLKESIWWMEFFKKNGQLDELLKTLLGDAYYNAAHASDALSLPNDVKLYLQKGCDIGDKDCCSKLGK